MRTSRINTLLAVALVFSLTGAAEAQAVLPPANSGANQYTEAFPGWRGNEPTGRLGGEDADPAKVLGPRNAARLEALGPAGRAVAALAAATAPDRTTAPSAGKAGSEDSSSASGPSQILGQITGTSETDGMGALFPLMLAMAAIAALAYALARRRAARPSD